jgi:hypothetical protein
MLLLLRAHFPFCAHACSQRGDWGYLLITGERWDEPGYHYAND